MSCASTGRNNDCGVNAAHNKRMQRTRQTVTHFAKRKNARQFAVPLMRGVEPVEKLLSRASL
jgi:hypothetical protein